MKEPRTSPHRTPPALRSVIAVSAGLFIGGLTIMGIEMLSHAVVAPVRVGASGDPDPAAAAMRAMPARAFVVLLVAYVVGPTVGAWIAARMAPSRALAHAGTVGAFFLIGGIANFRALPHPTWFVVAALLAFLAAPVLGTRLARR